MLLEFIKYCYIRTCYIVYIGELYTITLQSTYISFGNMNKTSKIFTEGHPLMSGRARSTYMILWPRFFASHCLFQLSVQVVFEKCVCVYTLEGLGITLPSLRPDQNSLSLLSFFCLKHCPSLKPVGSPFFPNMR